MPHTAEAQAFLAAHGGTELVPLAGAIGDVLQQKGRCVVGLDGMAAAGKTTAAALLCRAFGGACVHMDDFFLPPALRTPQRLAQPGGNVHYERFAEEVAPALRLGQAFCYGVFDCSRMALAGTRAVPAAPLTVVEGAYSLHPFFSTGLYDVRAYYAISPEAQKARILARNGPAALCAFEGKWIPMENAYAAAFGIRESCGVLLQAQPGGAQGQHV